MTPQPTTLIELYEQRRTDGEALLVEGVDGLSSCTSGGAWARAAQIAHVLEDHGVRPGDRIVLQVDKSTEALLVYLACVRAGAAIVPVNPAYTEAELVHLLGDAEPSLVIADPSLRMVNRNRGAGTRILIDELLGARRPPGYAYEPRSHYAVAAAVAQKRADWGVTIEPIAREAGLRFRPLRAEAYDFAIPADRWERRAVAALRRLLAPASPLRERLAELGFGE